MADKANEVSMWLNDGRMIVIKKSNGQVLWKVKYLAEHLWEAVEWGNQSWVCLGQFNREQDAMNFIEVRRQAYEQQYI